ncbi:hypothetical protein ACNVED_07325 [Legionella sp. D16C41]|uniref:hypothetical protein n=1 Tax=Legionella sp. D16C41 TaxID=3402688 RepID=UPI003AF652ED
MNAVLSKFINKFTFGLYIALVNSIAFAGSPSSNFSRYTSAWIAGGVLSVIAIGFIVAFVSDVDDEENIIICQ